VPQLVRRVTCDATDRNHQDGDRTNRLRLKRSLFYVVLVTLSVNVFIVSGALVFYAFLRR